MLQQTKEFWFMKKCTIYEQTINLKSAAITIVTVNFVALSLDF